MGHDLRSADNRHEFRPYVSFTGFEFFIAVRCGFDMHLYVTSCLNAHNHNTCIRLPQLYIYIYLFIDHCVVII